MLSSVGRNNLCSNASQEDREEIGLEVLQVISQDRFETRALNILGFASQIYLVSALLVSLSSWKGTSHWPAAASGVWILQALQLPSPPWADAFIQILHSSGPEGNSCCLHFNSWTARHSGRLKYGTVVLLFNITILKLLALLWFCKILERSNKCWSVSYLSASSLFCWVPLASFILEMITDATGYNMSPSLSVLFFPLCTWIAVAVFLEPSGFE